MVTDKKTTTEKSVSTKVSADKKKENKSEKKILKKIVKKEEIKKIEKDDVKTSRYLEAVGKRKTSVARVRLFTLGNNELIVNDKPYKEYFPGFVLQQIASSSLEKMKCEDRFRISIKVRGGGIHSQAEAVRHGIARVLMEFNPDFRKRLRKAGFVTRDPRKRERKKFGLKRARKAPQWSKR